MNHSHNKLCNFSFAFTVYPELHIVPYKFSFDGGGKKENRNTKEENGSLQEVNITIYLPIYINWKFFLSTSQAQALLASCRQLLHSKKTAQYLYIRINVGGVNIYVHVYMRNIPWLWFHSFYHFRFCVVGLASCNLEAINFLFDFTEKGKHFGQSHDSVYIQT